MEAKRGRLNACVSSMGSINIAGGDGGKGSIPAIKLAVSLLSTLRPDSEMWLLSPSPPTP